MPDNIVKKSIDRMDAFMGRHSSVLLSVIGMASDGAGAVSGLVFGNIGRVFSGTLGVAAVMPLFFFNNRTLKEGEIDPQDLRFLDRMKNSWKFWKYPNEFWSLGNLLQFTAMTFFAGPDTASKIGEATDTEFLISEDNFRPIETTYGFVNLTTNFINATVRESAEAATRVDLRPKGWNPLPKMRFDFNGAAEFTADRAKDFASQGWRMDKGAMEAVYGGAAAISLIGPNKVISRSYQYVLYPWIAESVYRHDWYNAASGGIAIFANYLFGRISKRAQKAEETPAPSVAPA